MHLLGNWSLTFTVIQSGDILFSEPCPVVSRVAGTFDNKQP